LIVWLLSLMIRSPPEPMVRVLLLVVPMVNAPAPVF
jgi:hypothetical protein